MEALDKKYINNLEEIKKSIQESELLKLYLEEEEEEQFKELVNVFEPEIDALYQEVAEHNPLQIIAFEKQLLDVDFEGLFLPRILGYSVLRNDISENYKYALSQDHFKEVLTNICNSLNFEELKSRIGQSIKVGFALSSDIWITNFLNDVSSPKVKSFLQSFRLDKFRDIRDRHTAFVRFNKQFANFNYQVAIFPENKTELTLNANALKKFLLYRAQSELNNDNLEPIVNAFIAQEEFFGEPEFTELLIVLGMSFNLNDKAIALIKGIFDTLRKEDSGFNEEFFGVILKFLKDKDIEMGADQYERLQEVISFDIDDDITAYFKLMKSINDFGFTDDEAIEAVRLYYDKYKGLSLQNECVREVIKSYFNKIMNKLSVEEYTEYFEINKIFIRYIDIFSNEKFNQDIKGMSLTYIKKLIRHYTDKRARDYQDIKKFVISTFKELGFMNAKQLTELFKSKRKKPAQS